jgi:hypothetical protein
MHTVINVIVYLYTIVGCTKSVMHVVAAVTIVSVLTTLSRAR